MDDPRRRAPAAGPDRPGGLRCGRAAGRRPAAVRHADRGLPRPARPRHDPDLRHPRRRGAARGRPDELLRVPCDLDLAAAEDREEAEAPVRRAGRRDARRAGRRRHGARHLARAARATSHSRVEVDRRIGLGVDCPPTGCCPPRWSRREADRGHRGLRCAPARRGPAADGHRLRAAGRRARLPAARRPRALPGGLPRASPPSTRADGRAAPPPGGVGAALPRALGRRLPERPGRPAPPAGHAPGRRTCPPRHAGRSPRSSSRPSSSSAISALLARGLTGAGAERSRVLDVLRGAGARRRRRGARRAARLPRQPACVTSRATACASSRPGRGRDPQLRAVGAGRADPAVRAGRVAWRAGGSAPGRPVRARPARGPADRRRGRAARDLGADRTRGRRDCDASAARVEMPAMRLASVCSCSSSSLLARAAAAAPARPTRPPRRRCTPTGRGALPDGRRLAVPARHRRPGLRQRCTASAARRAGRRPGPERVEPRRRLGGVDERRRRLVPQGLLAARRARRARLGGALRVGQLPLARVAQRPRVGTNAAPTSRSSSASSGSSAAAPTGS